jgi:rhamnose utilization protein RhaD (predicted bifunctional aldolase and dehydrogenase)
MRVKSALSGQFERNALRALSARLGGNPLLVQASSGNTSIKIDDVLWIKASGKWLIHAEENDFLVSVNLTEAKRCLRENTAIAKTQTNSPGSPCASIETAMHAVLPQKVVVHVHSVNTIAWAVREDGPRQLRACLAGLPWQWIPYTPSGVSLARKVENAFLSFPQTNVFVLANHGLVVCGNSCRSAEQLLAEVEQRLAITPRPAPAPKQDLLKQALVGSAWSLPMCAVVHALATDPISRRILSGGVLYPCQAIFLPGVMPVPACSLSLQEPCHQQGYVPPQVLPVEDHGVLVSEQMTRAEREILVGLANVVQRIDGSTSLRYLTAAEVSDLLNGEGDHYRQSANTNGHSKISDMGIYRAASSV